MGYTNHMVAHLWAQREKDSARSNNGNFSFAGSAIWSYATPIANIVETAGGTAVTLINPNTYSATTSGKHFPAVRRSIRGRGFTVPHIGVQGGRYQSRYNRESPDMHAANLEWLIARYRSMVAEIEGSRTIARPAWLERMQWAADDIRDYARLFGLTAERPDAQGDYEAAIAANRARAEANDTPENRAKRERAAAKREAARIERERIAALTAAEARAEWQAGGRLHYYGRDEQGGALLRVVGDNLETSQGASVPLSHAIRVFRFVKDIKHRIGDGISREVARTYPIWERNGHTVRVGHFQIDTVYADGSFRAGCHLINWPQIEFAANQAGVFDLPGDTSAEESTGH